MSDEMTVGFEKLKVRCLIGILPHERLQEQEIVMSLKVKSCSLLRSEEISATVDYTVLAALCKQIARSAHHGLLETLAQKILLAIAQQWDCRYGWIRLEKPAALASAECAFVECEVGA
ncbi:MAG TPA: dihydroneopterin aldolase [Rhabdochlamydiaceae bacterium]|jgi:dihydroneopterin aldolase